MAATSRRQFLGRIGSGIGAAAVGLAFADRLGLASARAPGRRERLRFGALDPLVDLLQETSADALLPRLVERLRAGLPLADLVGAAALANARALGGTDYNGYHALMAMVPSLEMAAQLEAPLAPLPVLKVLHRNARFVRAAGRADEDSLAPVEGAAHPGELAALARQRDLAAAERSLAALTAESEAAAYERIQAVVRDDANVHRVVLAWRARDLQRMTGADHALTLLRLPLRFCIHEDGQRARRGQPAPEIASVVPKAMAAHGLEGRPRGRRRADAAWIEALGGTVFAGERAAAADAVAAALAEEFDPEDVGAALSLAAVRLLLHDRGQPDGTEGRPRGSVHGATVGVHASDAANAWRHIARTGGPENAFASLIAGACHTAGQSRVVAADPFDLDVAPSAESDPRRLLDEIEGRVRDRDQRGACAAARRYCALGHAPDRLFAALLPFAVSEDGALHGEKYFRTAQEEHVSARPEHRALHLVALTRVMASSFGFPAPGCEEARRLLTA